MSKFFKVLCHIEIFQILSKLQLGSSDAKYDCHSNFCGLCNTVSFPIVQCCIRNITSECCIIFSSSQWISQSNTTSCSITNVTSHGKYLSWWILTFSIDLVTTHTLMSPVITLTFNILKYFQFMPLNVTTISQFSIFHASNVSVEHMFNQEPSCSQIISATLNTHNHLIRNTGTTYLNLTSSLHYGKPCRQTNASQCIAW